MVILRTIQHKADNVLTALKLASDSFHRTTSIEPTVAYFDRDSIQSLAAAGYVYYADEKRYVNGLRIIEVKEESYVRVGL